MQQWQQHLFNDNFQGTRVSWYQNIIILDFIAAKVQMLSNDVNWRQWLRAWVYQAAYHSKYAWQS